MSIPVQYFQSIITIELAITGALLWQIRYFEHRSVAQSDEDRPLPHPLIRLLVAVILAATMFGSLLGILHEGETWAAIAVTIGLAVSLLPILLRVLPPLARVAGTQGRDPHFAVTIVGLLLYVVVTAVFVILLSL